MVAHEVDPGGAFEMIKIRKRGSRERRRKLLAEIGESEGDRGIGRESLEQIALRGARSTGSGGELEIEARHPRHRAEHDRVVESPRGRTRRRGPLLCGDLSGRNQLLEQGLGVGISGDHAIGSGVGGHLLELVRVGKRVVARGVDRRLEARAQLPITAKPSTIPSAVSSSVTV